MVRQYNILRLDILDDIVLDMIRQ